MQALHMFTSGLVMYRVIVESEKQIPQLRAAKTRPEGRDDKRLPEGVLIWGRAPDPVGINPAPRQEPSSS